MEKIYFIFPTTIILLLVVLDADALVLLRMAYVSVQLVQVKRTKEILSAVVLLFHALLFHY